MARKFKARKLSESRLKQRASDSGSMFDKLLKDEYPIFSATEGAHRLRLMPGTFDEDAYWGYVIFVHYGVGPDQGQYLCPERMKTGDNCPICQERHTSDLDEETERQLRPTKRVASWVVDRNAEKEGPKIWLMPQTVDKDIADRCIDKMTNEVLDIVDPEDGYDIEFTREGSGINTRYIGINIARRQSPINRDESLLEKWLDFIENNPLNQVFNYYSPEHIERVFRGVSAAGKDTSPRRASSDAVEESAEKEIDEGPMAIETADGAESVEEEKEDVVGADDDERQQRMSSLQERLRAKREGK